MLYCLIYFSLPKNVVKRKTDIYDVLWIIIQASKPGRGFELKIKISTLDVVLLCATFYEITILPHMLFIAFKYVVLGYLLCKYMSEYKKMKRIMPFVLIYGAVTFFSTAYHRMAFNTIIASLMYGIQIAVIFLVTSWFLRFRRTEKFIEILFKVFFVYALITDLFMLFLPYDFNNPAEVYLIGNKFIVSYLHSFLMFLLFFLETKKQEKCKKMAIHNLKGIQLANLKVWLPSTFALLLSVAICNKVTCSTGIVICILYGALMLIPIELRKMLSNHKTVILITVVLNILILGNASLFTNPFVANFIKNVMNKSYTWTGRLRIYAIIMDIIKDSPVIGYGYFNNIVANVVSFGNAQNGVLKIVVDSGIVGLIGYTGIAYISLQNRNAAYTKSSWTLYAFIYVMIAASLVEINLTHMIVFFSFAINMCIMDGERKCSNVQ